MPPIFGAIELPFYGRWAPGIRSDGAGPLATGCPNGPLEIPMHYINVYAVIDSLTKLVKFIRSNPLQIRLNPPEPTQIRSDLLTHVRAYCNLGCNTIRQFIGYLDWKLVLHEEAAIVDGLKFFCHDALMSKSALC